MEPWGTCFTASFQGGSHTYWKARVSTVWIHPIFIVKHSCSFKGILVAGLLPTYKLVFILDMSMLLCVLEIWFSVGWPMLHRLWRRLYQEIIVVECRYYAFDWMFLTVFPTLVTLTHLSMVFTSYYTVPSSNGYPANRKSITIQSNSQWEGAVIG
jgi:hypothetical protein